MVKEIAENYTVQLRIIDRQQTQATVKTDGIIV